MGVRGDQGGGDAGTGANGGGVRAVLEAVAEGARVTFNIFCLVPLYQGTHEPHSYRE